MGPHKSPNSYILLVIVLWASTAAVGKLLLQDISSMQLLFYTCVFASFSLFITILFQRRIKILTVYSLFDLANFMAMGFLGVFLYTFCLFEAIKRLTAHEAFIINYLWPILVVAFSVILFRETFTIKKLLGIIFSFSGVLLLFTKGNILAINLNDIVGTIFALVGAVAYAMYSVIGKRQGYDKYASTMFNYLFAAFFTLPFLLPSFTLPSFSIPQWLAILWLGVFANGFAFVFWFQALRHGETVKMTNLVYFTPFLSLVYSYILLGEEILITSYIGLFFIVSGIFTQYIKV